MQEKSPPKTALKSLEERISNCQRCTRLTRHCQRTAQIKKREFREEAYWGKPVAGFGDPKPKIWIIGLAPGAHGANRTGRMFTGDSSGRWLYGALFDFGWASQRESLRRSDKLLLKSVYISAAARCAPPDNKPTREELNRCSVFLDQEWQVFKPHVRLIIALGGIAFASTLELLKRFGEKAPSPSPRFCHNGLWTLGSVPVLSSYHPSRQNTQTGRLTWEMWTDIFARAKGLSGA